MGGRFLIPPIVAAVVVFTSAAAVAQPVAGSPAQLYPATAVDGHADESTPPSATVLRLNVALDPEAAAWIFSAAAVADWATTIHVVGLRGGHENDRLVSWAPNAASVVAAGAALDVLAGATWTRVMRGHPRVAAIGLYAAAGMRSFVAARNEYRLAHTGICGVPPPCQLNCIEAFSRCR